jgi:hypothetical protein
MYLIHFKQINILNKKVTLKKIILFKIHCKFLKKKMTILFKNHYHNMIKRRVILLRLVHNKNLNLINNNFLDFNN